ncbi:alkyl sulfatase dimerization domain-containing protein [Variovorax humicola]|uniref:Alkyl sulfatase dimerization domain-containing protein n=1 Tax=Variovorax humicola TaxID=1769758 RepID=A0ABU8W662_9BURK
MNIRATRLPKKTAWLAALTVAVNAAAQTPDLSPKPASPQTLAANKAFAATRDVVGKQETEDATRGLIGRLDNPEIKDAAGNVVWDGDKQAFLKGDAPGTVNPSLWQASKLTAQHGLFKVTEGIWQVRNYDIDNMTIVAGKTGWIVIDPTMSVETAKAGMALVEKHLGKRPVRAMIYTHTHADHFGGARALVDEASIKAQGIRIIAPDGFMENAIAENVLAGNAMTRRAQYQFGSPLPYGERGAVGVGLGSKLSLGTVSLIAPTETITKTGQELVVDGVRIVFQLAPSTEAPSEMLFYFPDMKALCLAEDVNKTMHNIYTLRGAKARDALGWSKYVNELLDLFPDAEVAFGSHTWPTWGKDRVVNLITKQRDMFRFINDEALRLANSGQKMDDIGNAAYYPKALTDEYATRGYYGSLSHNLRGAYSYYLGWYDGNPATLYRYPVAESARRYVAALGGANAVLTQARAAADAGDYRWAAELGNHAVLADGNNMQARALQADALEQIGYQSENGVWRNEYLSAAKELREGVKPVQLSVQGPDVARAMTLEQIFDLIAVRLNHAKVEGRDVGINFVLTDTGERYALELSNTVLNHTKGRVLTKPAATLSISRNALFKMLVARVPLPDLIKAGEAKLDGDGAALGTIFANLDTFNPNFGVVTP